jgi:hypothetical protein
MRSLKKRRRLQFSNCTSDVHGSNGRDKMLRRQKRVAVASHALFDRAMRSRQDTTVNCCTAPTSLVQTECRLVPPRATAGRA